MEGRSRELSIRLRAFEWLAEQQLVHGDVLPRALLARGVETEEGYIPLVSPQGIFTPRGFNYPLTITTVADGPYPDRFLDEDRLLYKYRGTDPQHRDNVLLRNAKRDEVPLIYLLGVAAGQYFPIFPIFVVGDDPRTLEFTVVADRTADTRSKDLAPEHVGEHARELERRYATAAVQRRIHQAAFRERVLMAYRTSCTVCRLKHRDLLDAAHIIPDHEPAGLARVSNGLSLCKIHHAAFDSHILGIRPDYVVEIRQDVLIETDGPMLKHGLQALHNEKIGLPSKKPDWPAPEALEERYDRFRSYSP